MPPWPHVMPGRIAPYACAAAAGWQLRVPGGHSRLHFRSQWRPCHRVGVAGDKATAGCDAAASLLNRAHVLSVLWLSLQARNSAEQLIYSSEKSIEDFKDKVTPEIVESIRTAINDLREHKESEDLEVIKEKSEALSKATQKIGEHMSSQSGGGSGGGGDAAGGDKAAGG